MVRDYERQTALLKDSSVAFLGQVVAQGLSPSNSTREVKVKPVYWLKGNADSLVRALTVAQITSCGPTGDGDATMAPLQEWAFVFEGLPRSPSRPNGRDSILARDALTRELISAMWQVGKDPEE